MQCPAEWPRFSSMTHRLFLMNVFTKNTVKLRIRLMSLFYDPFFLFFLNSYISRIDRTNQRRNHFMNQNTMDEDTSGYLSDLSNFVYPSSADELTSNLNGMRMTDKKIDKQQQRHRQIANDDMEYNEQETVFSMPK